MPTTIMAYIWDMLIRKELWNAFLPLKRQENRWSWSMTEPTLQGTAM